MATERIGHATLTAALATPDEGVARPGRVQPTSAITQIAALKPGECWSRVEPANRTISIAEFAFKSAEHREMLRNAVSASVRHAKAKTDGTYSIEVGDFITSGRNIYLVCVVTRVE